MILTPRSRSQLVMFLVIIASNISCDKPAEQKSARECAQAFHAGFRAQRYEEIYSNASQRFQAIRTKDEYGTMMQRIENEYGKLINAKEEGSATVVNTALGQMQVLVFAVEFEKTKATERLTFIRESTGQMRLWMFELS